MDCQTLFEEYPGCGRQAVHTVQISRVHGSSAPGAGAAAASMAIPKTNAYFILMDLVVELGV